MKSALRTGCWTALALLLTAGVLIALLVATSRDRGSEVSLGEAERYARVVGEDVEIGRDDYVEGNLLVFGGDLELKGTIGGSAMVVGGDAALVGRARVGGNVSVLGGDLEIKDSSVVGGDAAVAGGDASLEGRARVGGRVRVVGGELTRSSGVQVGWAAGGRTVTGAAAFPAGFRAGPARMAAPEEDVQARLEVELEAAEDSLARFHAEADGIRLQAERIAEEALAEAERQLEAAQPVAPDVSRQPGYDWRSQLLRFAGRLLQAFLWTLLISGLVVLFYWLLPSQTDRIARTAEGEAALSFATGAIVTMGTTLLSVLLTITICLALLALPLMALLALVSLGGWAATSLWLGRRLDAFLAAQGEFSWHPLISVGLSSLSITGIASFAWAVFPCLGVAVALLIGSTGTGAVIVHMARRSGWRGRGSAASGGSGGGPVREGPGQGSPGEGGGQEGRSTAGQPRPADSGPGVE